MTAPIPVAWISFDAFRALNAGKPVVTTITAHKSFNDDAPLFTAAQLLQVRADVLREAAERLEQGEIWMTKISVSAYLRRMADEYPEEAKK